MLETKLLDTARISAPQLDHTAKYMNGVFQAWLASTEEAIDLVSGVITTKRAGIHEFAAQAFELGSEEESSLSNQYMIT